MLYKFFTLLLFILISSCSVAQTERKTTEEKARLKTEEMVKTYTLNKSQKEKISELNNEYYKNLLAVNIKYKSDASVLEFERNELLKIYDDDVLEIFNATQDEKYKKEILNRSKKVVKKKK